MMTLMVIEVIVYGGILLLGLFGTLVKGMGMVAGR